MRSQQVVTVDHESDLIGSNYGLGTDHSVRSLTVHLSARFSFHKLCLDVGSVTHTKRMRMHDLPNRLAPIRDRLA